MSKLQSNVLKSQVLRKGQPRRLAASPTAPLADGRPAAGPAQARIVAQTDDGALVEVTCSCGRTVHLECGPADPGQEP